MRISIGLIKSCLLRIYCVAAAGCIFGSNLAWSAEDSVHEELPIHHVSVFAGGGVDNESGDSSRAGFAIGVAYEYRFHERWGIGAAVEALGQTTIRNGAVAFPVSFHLTEHWRLFAGPGVEFTDHGNEFLIRTGVGYEIPLAGKWTIAPEVVADFIEGGTILLIGGVALGYEF